MNKDSLWSQVDDFAERFVTVLKDLGLYDACLYLEMDHVCIRLNDSTDVFHLKSELEEVGVLISATRVNGREIYIIELNEPLQIGPWSVSGIELPHPKPGHSYKDGWEHAEFVFPIKENSLDAVYSNFMEYFLNMQVAEGLYSLKKSNPHAEGDQIPNPTVAISCKGIGIKFHARSIQEVVGYKKPSR